MDVQQHELNAAADEGDVIQERADDGVKMESQTAVTVDTLMLSKREMDLFIMDDPLLDSRKLYRLLIEAYSHRLLIHDYKTQMNALRIPSATGGLLCYKQYNNPLASHCLDLLFMTESEYEVLLATLDTPSALPHYKNGACDLTLIDAELKQIESEFIQIKRQQHDLMVMKGTFQPVYQSYQASAEALKIKLELATDIDDDALHLLSKTYQELEQQRIYEAALQTKETLLGYLSKLYEIYLKRLSILSSGELGLILQLGGRDIYQRNALFFKTHYHHTLRSITHDRESIKKAIDLQIEPIACQEERADASNHLYRHHLFYKSDHTADGNSETHKRHSNAN